MVWGAGGGIGRALVATLSDDGWTVLAMARQLASLAELTPHTIEADVGDPESVQRAVAAASERVAEVGLWIYTAGDIASTRMADMSPSTWKRILDANLTGAYLTSHHSLRLLAADAHLFFLGAVTERIRLPGLAAYAASKAGLEALVDVLRKEQRKRRVTIVRPGAVDTPLWRKVPFKLPPRALSPEAVADRILAAYSEGHRGVLDL
jgi:NAD(P)-dependent dehydrogenase (short-subunit alcohol dehydrogenase family)